MTTTLKTRRKKGVHYSERFFGGDEPGGQRQNVRVVVLTCKCRDLGIPCKSRPNPLVLVGCDVHAVPTSTYQNAQVRLLIGYALCNRVGKIRIVHTFQRSCARICHLYPLKGEMALYFLFEHKASVVSADK